MLIYNAGVRAYTLAIHFFSLFNSKAKLWVEGRRNWKLSLQEKTNRIKNDKKIWMHCASLGEFEQGRPVIEKIKSNYPNYKIVLSFFSPSGFEIRKNYEHADVIIYLPSDTEKNARDFISIIKPEFAVFVKYEFWLNYLFELNKQKIPVYLISAIFREHHPFFKWYGKDFINALKIYHKIFVQDTYSAELLKKINIETAMICGDTRIDRVASIKTLPADLPLIQNFSENATVIVAGSTWPNDDEIILNAFRKLSENHSSIKLIIAPHETEIKNIQTLINKINKSGLNFVLYSGKNPNTSAKVLVIDSVGILSLVYRFGKIAYIGGGFNNGIHNILEPAVYSLPVVFGPNHKKFNEATILLSKKAAFEISDSNQCFEILNQLISKESLLNKAGYEAGQYISANEGATDKIIEQVFNIIK